MVTGIAWAALAQADDRATSPSWSLSGFGTAGAAYSDHADADYVSSPLQTSGVGHSGHWSAELDSRLGIQLNVKLDPQWSAVLQVISEHQPDHSYRPAVEWANIKYQITPDLSIRFGRIALPMFLAADYRKIGYAYPWVRTPVEVYGAIPISHSDGVDATYRWNRGGLKNLTQVYFGRTNLKLPGGDRIQARKLAGLSNTVEYGAVSARLSMLTSELTIDVIRDFFDALRQFGPQGAALAEHYAIDHSRASAFNIGITYDPGNWFVMGELGRMKTRSFFIDTRGAYASAGYRLGDFTPYLSYARVSLNSQAGEPGLNLTGLPPAAVSFGAGLNAYLGQLRLAVPVQRTVSIGARWDCITDVALKVQFDRVTPQGGSRGTFINVQPGFRSGHPVNVASAVLDFVF
jgi:hypothetical protein